MNIYEILCPILSFSAFIALYFQERRYLRKMEEQRYHFQERINLMRMTEDCYQECENIAKFYRGKLPSVMYRNAIRETINNYRENPIQFYQGKFKVELSEISHDAYKDYSDELTRIRSAFLIADECADPAKY